VGSVLGRAGRAGGDALCATLYAGGCRRWALFAGGAGVLEAMRGVPLFILEAVEGELCLSDVLEVLEAMNRVLLCLLEAAESEFCLLEVL